MFEITGKIKVISETQTFPSGFMKREFVVTTAHDKYPQDIKFEVVKEKCGILDEYQLEQAVQVNFDIRGNEYNGKYYVNLACWKLQPSDAVNGGGAAPATKGAFADGPKSSEPSAADLRNDDDFDDDAIPF